MCSEEHLKDSNIKACPLSGVPNEAKLSTDSFDIYIVPKENNMISVDTVDVPVKESLTKDSKKKSESLCMFKANVLPKTFHCHSKNEPEMIPGLKTLHTQKRSKLEHLDVENATSCDKKEESTNQKVNRPTRKVEAKVSEIVQETCTKKKGEHPMNNDICQNNFATDVSRIIMPSKSKSKVDEAMQKANILNLLTYL